MKDYTNYYNTNLTDKLLHDGIKTFDRSLTTSPDSYVISVDSVSKNVLVQSTANYNERRILFKEGDLSWGDIIIHENEKWLLTERPFFNKIHEKSKIRLCNNTMEFTKIVEGEYTYDQFGNKIYTTQPSTEYVNIPCVVESISELNGKTTTGENINVPEGDMVLQISYTTDDLIAYGSEFKMFDNTYKISGIDKSKVHNSKGILILVVSRTTNNT